MILQNHMQKFVAIYSTPRSEIAKFMKMPKEKMQKEIEAENKRWSAWFKKNKKHLVDPGDIFGKTKRVMHKGISDVKNELTGYTIVKAKSHEAAARIFKTNPQLRSGRSKIEVMVCLGWMGK